MSLNEMQAERDRVRAEYAVAMRRVEADAKVQKTKANERMVESARLSEHLKLSEQAGSDRSAAIAARDVTIADLQARLASEREALAAVKEKLSLAERNLADKSLAYEELSRLYEEASLLASNRQIDLLARDADIDRLSATVTQLRTQRGENEQKVREQSAAELRVAEDLKTERRRAADLEAKLERLMRDLSDREETIGRRDKTILQLRGQAGAPTPDTQAGSDYAAQAQIEAGTDATSRELVQLRRDLRRAEQTEEDLRLELTQAQATAMRLEAELADQVGQPHVSFGSQSTGVDVALARLEADRDRLEAQLFSLAAENDRLRQQAARTGPAEGAVAPAVAGAGLRDELAQIAAQMVHMTRVLEGPGSPIDTALAAPSSGGGKPGALTLADRIRALQQAASVSETPKPVQRDR
jgi:chromosome segregation ATPase